MQREHISIPQLIAYVLFSVIIFALQTGTFGGMRIFGSAVDLLPALVTAAALLGEGGYDYVASCGPAVMMKKVAAAAAEAGAYCEVSLERMMSCGFGACSTCNVETVDGMAGACVWGPVVDASKVVVF